MSTTRLTMAQALVKFLDNQYVEIDGVQSKFVAGVFTIFGHGNVLGLGQALEQDSGELVVHQGRNEQGMCHAAIGFAKQHLRRKDLRLYLIGRAGCGEHDYGSGHGFGQPHSIAAAAR